MEVLGVLFKQSAEYTSVFPELRREAVAYQRASSIVNAL